MRTLKFGMLVMAIAMGISACKKVEGPQGPAGTNGTNGINGTNGNANVIGTDPFTVNSGNWSITGNTYYVALTANGLTQQVCDKGMVMVYRQVSGSWKALPETSGSIHYFYSFTPGSLIIYVQATTGVAINNPSSNTFRAVFVSPSQIKENPDVNWSDYKQAQKALDL